MPQLSQEVNHFDKIHVVNLVMNQSIRKFYHLISSLSQGPKLLSAENADLALFLVDTAVVWQLWRRWPYEEIH